MFYQDGGEPEFSLTVGTGCHLAVVLITQRFVKLEKILSRLCLAHQRLHLDLLGGFDDERFGLLLQHGRRTDREVVLSPSTATTQWERVGRRRDIGGLHWAGQ